MIDTSDLRLRSIHDLLGERFWVPSYQRGYRWDRQQVEALLNDIDEFQRSARTLGPDTYYCLQPVVVRRRKDATWEVVDGQQRLTTIALILRALRDVAAMIGRSAYSLEYETRPGSSAFLNEPTPEGAHTNIDFHHMYQAYEAIQQWFAGKDGGRRLRLLECLTGPDGDDANVRVIWYELDPEAPAVDAFVRLNVGRIPLTSAELIRAVVLLHAKQDSVDNRDERQIPQDWDVIERRLQDDAYWMFLQSGRTPPPARIEHVLDLFVRVDGIGLQAARDDDPLATFLTFQAILGKERGRVREIWARFKKLAQTLEEWFEDRTLYHLVGFLVEVAPDEKLADGRTRRGDVRLLLDLLDRSARASRSEFERQLRQLALRRFLGGRGEDGVGKQTGTELATQVEERLNALHYEQREPVRTALLLFNIAALLEQRASTARFLFDAYKRTDWDIEHVRSVQEQKPQSAAERKRWLGHARRFVETPTALGRDATEARALGSMIDGQLGLPSPDATAFGDVFHRVRALSGEAEPREGENLISNLALLDMGTNRSYRNAIFPVKRGRIIDLDREGQFVPPATRNVFLKFYSPDAAQLMLWHDDDATAYREAIRSTLVRFFAPLALEEAP